MRRIFCVLLTLFLTLPASAVPVPVLMYHHFTETDTGLPDQCDRERFRGHLKALTEAGYSSVTFRDLLAYADGTGDLPDKPVVLTSDDGYRSVIDIALPVLREYGMSMSVAVVGSMAGKTEGLPHFSVEEAFGTELELVSHTWDLHGQEGCGVLTEKGTLHPRFLWDTVRMGQIPAVSDRVFVYPYGKWNPDSEAVLHALGYRITVTTRCGIADIRPGEPDSLRLLPRMHPDEFLEKEIMN